MNSNIIKTHDSESISARKTKINSWKCKVDLAIKKIAIDVIGLMNLALISSLLVATIYFTPIPQEFVVASALVVGVLDALVLLKVRTSGITSVNYKPYSNPLAWLGLGATLVLFGPVVFVDKKCDKTAYYDPIIARNITEALENKEFVEVIKICGTHFSNLQKYGFIPRKSKAIFRKFYKQLRAIQKDIKYYDRDKTKDNEVTTKLNALNKKIAAIETQWTEYRSSILSGIPKLKLSKRSPRKICRLYHKIENWLLGTSSMVNTSA